MKLSPEAGRESAMDAGLRQAINVPLNLAKHVDTVWDTLVQMAAVGNINCKSDLQVFFFLNKRAERIYDLVTVRNGLCNDTAGDGWFVDSFFL